MRSSKNPDTVRNNLWRDQNPEKYKRKRLRDAYNLLVKNGVIIDGKVTRNPNNT